MCFQYVIHFLFWSSGILDKFSNFLILEEKYVVLSVSQYSELTYARNYSMLLLFHSCWVRLDFYINLQ